jgi:hypothetical protein
MHVTVFWRVLLWWYQNNFNMKVQVDISHNVLYQSTDKIRFQLDCVGADKVVQWWAYVDVHACTLMPQEMLQMCNKGLFTGTGLAGLEWYFWKTSACIVFMIFYLKIVFTWLDQPGYNQAWKSGYNACLKICNNFTLTPALHRYIPLVSCHCQLACFVLKQMASVIWQGELAKGAGSESNSCKQLLSPNYIDNYVHFGFVMHSNL